MNRTYGQDSVVKAWFARAEQVCGEDLGRSRASRGRVIEGWSGIEKSGLRPELKKPVS